MPGPRPAVGADGEGATKPVESTLADARDRAEAKRVAKAVVNSPPVETAVHGADPEGPRRPRRRP
ncbi:bifunctional ornithine acetyltransferase/N-acetylglutamate synthase [Peterkaempfera bronchialis]|uniref:bifunctional ornithine acetyltransferase/N-acetylglutamate synthase n=1 Tax=Peterkaempfera bronchialis TaxID=2126346 RepID=UPI00389A0B65